MTKQLHSEKVTERLRRRAEQTRIRRAKRTEEQRILDITKNSLNRKLREAKETEEERLLRLQRKASRARLSRANKIALQKGRLQTETLQTDGPRRNRNNKKEKAHLRQVLESSTLTETESGNSNIWNEISSLRVWVATMKKATVSVIKRKVKLAVQEFLRKKGKNPKSDKDLRMSRKRLRERNRARIRRRNKQPIESVQDMKVIRQRQLRSEKQLQAQRMRRYVNQSDGKHIGGLISIPIQLADDYSNSDLNAKNFVCIVCTDQFKTYHGLMTHIRLHSGIEISTAKEQDSHLKGKNSVEDSRKALIPELQCEVCSDTFISMTSYRQHVIDAHPENRELLNDICYSCSICQEAFSKKRAVVNHMRDFHEISTQCPICRQYIKKQELFTQHMKENHADEYNSNSEVVKCSDGHFCKICGFTNDRPSDVSKHFKNVHSDNRSFQCDICDQKFGTKSTFESHKFNLHEHPGHCCEICGKHVTISAFKRHMESHDERLCQKLKVECKLCKRTFATAATLRVHRMAVHMDQKLFQCTVCGREFNCQSSLHSHRTLVCEKDKAKKSTCPICNKMFENYIILRAHKANIHKYGNTEEDFCHLCNKKFKNQICLHAHNNSYHQGAIKYTSSGKVNKELKCSVCEKRFPSRKFLLDHWRTHREERPYQCSICALTYKQPQGYHLHKRCKHKNGQDSPMMLVNEEINQLLKEAFQEAHALQFAQARQNEFEVLNRNLETTVDHIQVGDSLVVAAAEVMKGSGLDGDVTLTGATVNTVQNKELDFEASERSIDTMMTTGIADKLSDPVLYNCSPELNENMSEILVRTEMSQSSDLDGSKSIAVSENPANIIEGENLLPSPDCGNDVLSRENLQLSLSKDIFNETNESGWFIDDYDDSSSFQGQNSPFSKNQPDVLPLEDLKDVKQWNNVVDKLFLGDPYKKQLIVKLKKLKEYSCSLCDKIFYHSKLYKRHLNSRTHRSTARINQQQAIKIKSEFDDDEKEADDAAIVTQSKTTNENKKGIQKSIKLKKNLCCDICGNYYKSVSSLCSHRRRHIYEKICEQCGQSFKSKRNYECHVKALHSEGEFSCTICGIVFNQKFQLKLHRREHLKKEKYKRVKVNKEGVNSSENTEPFICEACGKVFGTRRRMVRHRKMHENKSFKCDLCPKTLSSSRSLKDHVDSVHLKKKHLCPECGNLYSSTSTLSEHMLIHKGTPRKPSNKRRLLYQNQNLECELCSRTFTNRFSYKQHMIAHSGVKIKCKDCGKEFSNQLSMYKHARSHRNSQYNFCSICSLSYNTQEGYDRHVKSIHDPSRPFPCDKCYSFFNHKSNLIHHNKNAHLKLGIVYKKKKKLKPPVETETTLQT